VSIVTAAGDGGTTGLLDGTRVPKDHPRIECLGALDELNAHLGDARCALAGGDLAGTTGAKAAEMLKAIQGELFTVAGILAAPAGGAGGTGADPAAAPGPAPPPGEERLGAWVRELEAAIPIRGFALPGANPLSAKLDIARTVCRRAERRIVSLDRLEGVPAVILRYMNRLSDLLFMLARSAVHR
jgi:cob(I)alamin adenosyltransferase